MATLIIRHSVQDFAQWKAAYDEHAGARANSGTSNYHVFRNADNPNEVVVMSDVDDMDKARAFLGSDDLRQTMEKGGVAGPPDIVFLNEAG